MEKPWTFPSNKKGNFSPARRTEFRMDLVLFLEYCPTPKIRNRMSLQKSDPNWWSPPCIMQPNTTRLFKEFWLMSLSSDLSNLKYENYEWRSLRVFGEPCNRNEFRWGNGQFFVDSFERTTAKGKAVLGSQNFYCWLSVWKIWEKQLEKLKNSKSLNISPPLKITLGKSLNETNLPNSKI